MTHIRPRTIESFKRYAKAYKKAERCTHTEALEFTARQFGFNTYREAQRHYVAGDAA